MTRVISLCVVLGYLCSQSVMASSYREKVLNEADKLLNTVNISYAWGGHSINPKLCAECSACLNKAGTAPKKQLEICPVCNQCSLDCSHFIETAFDRAGLATPYLTTRQMNRLEAKTLRKSYGWIDLGRKVNRILPADILVYDGHVVLVEKVSSPGVGQVIHSTSGDVIKRAGEGIQRQTLVPFANFKGPLLKILRHRKIASTMAKKHFRRQKR